jgi:hypothetical protein
MLMVYTKTVAYEFHFPTSAVFPGILFKLFNDVA